MRQHRNNSIRGNIAHKWIAGNPTLTCALYLKKPHPEFLGDRAVLVQFRFQTCWILLRSDGTPKGGLEKLVQIALRFPDDSVLLGIGYADYLACHIIPDSEENCLWRSALHERAVETSREFAATLE